MFVTTIFKLLKNKNYILKKIQLKQQNQNNKTKRN